MNFVNTFRHVYKASVLLAVFVWMACDTSEEVFDDAISFSHCEADWVRDAVFYQIFPERFRNGDPDNDPIRASIDNVDQTPSTWEVMPWTDDWYVRSEWERELGDDFYDGVFRRRYGGDLQGVLDKLAYLQELGINTIYFNPLFHARSLHKYDGSSFHHIDPYFGPDPAGDLALIAREVGDDPNTWVWTAADSLFLTLIDQMHAHGMRIIIDGVFNHAGRDFFAFADLAAHQTASRFESWYNVTSWDNPATEANEFDWEGWWGFKPLPEFADSEDELTLADGPAAYIDAITQRWMDPNGDGDPSDGVDGWRLDVATDVPSGFWRTWHERVCTLNPSAYTLAEIWDESSEYLKETGFGGAMNYHGFAYPVTGYLIDGMIGPSVLVDRMENISAESTYLNLIDSHDTDRLASMIVNRTTDEYERSDRFDYDHGASPRHNAAYRVNKPGDRERQIQRLVVLLQMTWTGAPMVYYGSESGMWGADDPDDRMPMVWDDLDYATQSADPLGRQRSLDEVAFDSSLFDYYRRAIHLRHSHEALRHGALDIRATTDTSMTLRFERQHENQSMIILINRGETAQQVGSLDLRPDQELNLVFVSRDVDVHVRHGGEIQLPALTGAVLEVTDADI